jgi:ribosomal protein S18 acetylase RimI-like enzyme
MGSGIAMERTIHLRPIEADDEELLYRVYASTRDVELAQVDWDEAQKTAFLRMQFAAQHQYYQEHYVDTTWDVILIDDQAAGRLYVARWPEEIRIVDIALLPAYRNVGVGSILLRELQREAEQAGKALRIHVERFNPALRLYARLGFGVLEDRGVYYLMQWTPSPETKP